MTADLTVCGRGEGDDEVTMRSLLEAAMMDSGRPLLIPGATKPFALPERIAIAWKPTPQAARAVAEALPLLERAKQITVVTVDEGDAGRGDAEPLLAYLGWHGLSATIERIAPDDQGAPETLLAAASVKAADLLVMGGYGHGRLREWIFGGFTQHMLRAAPRRCRCCSRIEL
jgi:nucleotide-binding universal stress UspA family protein